jgi:hypothetical protein
VIAAVSHASLVDVVKHELRAQPDHVVAAGLAHFVLDAPVDVARAKHATEANPKDWLAWLLLADGLHQQGERAAGNMAAVPAVEAASADRSVEIPLVAVKKN